MFKVHDGDPGRLKRGLIHLKVIARAASFWGACARDDVSAPLRDRIRVLLLSPEFPPRRVTMLVLSLHPLTFTVAVIPAIPVLSPAPWVPR